jgi:archaemetzincin
MAAYELQLMSVGKVSREFLKEFEEPLLSVLGVGSFVSKQQLDVPAFSFNKERNQYNTTSIMRRVASLREPRAIYVIGVTDVDLFQPESNFVYGESDRENKSGVLSLFRLKSELGESWKRRTFVEALHLTAHLIGLSICEDARCVMFLATTITDAERRQLHLCSNCKNEWARLRT